MSIRISIDLLDDGSILVPADVQDMLIEWGRRTGKQLTVSLQDFYDDPEVLDVPKPRQDSTTHRAILLPPGMVAKCKSAQRS